LKEQTLVDARHRYRRLRLLIRKLNGERKKQAKKIDILCNDLIAAQRDFIGKLGIISFAANFYESIVGTADLGTLVHTAGKLLNEKIADTNVAFFLRRRDSFEMHMFESTGPVLMEKEDLENFFTVELVDNICKSNKICTLNDMFAMGLEGNLVRLNKISAATIPLGQLGSSLGFVFICRSSENELTPDELHSITAVAPGLSRAIQSCRVAVGNAE
jgi:hypothetical protein